MKRSLISIIIPVYNVERYMRKCIDSVLTQTYKNLEIILIDDGSTDNSGQICDEYAKKDTRIKVIHQTNAGVSAARNTGLKVVTGEYIGFVDSDDYIKPQMYETMLNAIIRNQANMAMCGIIDIYENGTIRPTKFCNDKDYLYDNYKKWIRDFINYGSYEVSCNKLFHRNLLKDLYFDTTLKRAEDVNWVCEVTFRPIKIIYCHVQFYYYLSRNSSAVHQKKIEYFENEFTVWEKILQKIKNSKLNDLLPDIKNKVANRAYKLAVLIILYDVNSKYQERLEHLQRLFKDLVKQRQIFPDYILRTWIYWFGKHPNIVITTLRLSGIKQLLSYYICHKGRVCPK